MCGLVPSCTYKLYYKYLPVSTPNFGAVTVSTRGSPSLAIARQPSAIQRGHTSWRVPSIQSNRIIPWRDSVAKHDFMEAFDIVTVGCAMSELLG